MVIREVMTTNFVTKKSGDGIAVTKIYIDGHESKPANSKFSKKFLFDKFEGDTFLHNVLKNLVPSMSLYPSFRQLSKPAISHSDTFQRNKTG